MILEVKKDLLIYNKTYIQILVKDRDLKKVPDEGRLLLVKDRDGLAL